MIIIIIFLLLELNLFFLKQISEATNQPPK